MTSAPLTDAGSDALDALQRLAAYDREGQGSGLPEFMSAAALWSARLFYQVCQLTVCRDLGESRVQAAFAAPCPTARSPATDWTVDLVLRYLPRVFDAAHQLSNADLLVKRLAELAELWPLSSVGVPVAGRLQLDSFIGHPVLRRVYADRILARQDLSRLGDPRVDDQLRADLGIYHELAPRLASRLFPAPP